MPTRNSPRIKRLRKWIEYRIINKNGNEWTDPMLCIKDAEREAENANLRGIFKPYRIAIIECREVVPGKKRKRC